MTLFPNIQKTGGKWVWSFVLVQEQKKETNKQFCLLSVSLAFLSFYLPKISPVLQSGKLSLKKVKHLYRLHSRSGVGADSHSHLQDSKGPCCLRLCTFPRGDLGSWTVFHFTKMKFLLFSFKAKSFFSPFTKRIKRKKENFLWPMEKIIQCFACWQKARSCGSGCEREGERFSWTATAPPTHICVSLRLT